MGQDLIPIAGFLLGFFIVPLVGSLYAVNYAAGPRPRQVLIGATAGIAIYALYMTLAGLGGGLRHAAVLTWVGAAAAACWVVARYVSTGRKSRRVDWSAWRPPDLQSRILLWLLIIFQVGMFVNALAPFVSLDAETYHHVFIRNFITSGHIGVIAGDPYSYYPLSLEVVTSTAFAIGGPEASNLCLLFMQLLLLGWIIDWLAQAGRAREGYILATLICGLAFWPELSYSGFVDIGVATFAIAGAITFFDWLQNRSLKGSHSTILLAGLFAGAAAASKHSALPLAALIFVHLVWLVMADRRNRRSAVLAFLGFALMFLIPVAPWYIRNLIITGNPVFPFLRSIFGGPESLLGDDIGTWSSWGLPITLKNYIIYPLKLAWFYSVDYIPLIRFPYVYMTWLFALVPISGILLLHRRISRIIAIWCFVFFNFAFFMMNLQTRYFVPFTILALSLVAGWLETFVSATPAPELGNSLSPRERVGVRDRWDGARH